MSWLLLPASELAAQLSLRQWFSNAWIARYKVVRATNLTAWAENCWSKMSAWTLVTQKCILDVASLGLHVLYDLILFSWWSIAWPLNRGEHLMIRWVMHEGSRYICHSTWVWWFRYKRRAPASRSSDAGHKPEFTCLWLVLNWWTICWSNTCIAQGNACIQLTCCCVVVLVVTN